MVDPSIGTQGRLARALGTLTVAFRSPLATSHSSSEELEGQHDIQGKESRFEGFFLPSIRNFKLVMWFIDGIVPEIDCLTEALRNQPIISGYSDCRAEVTVISERSALRVPAGFH